MILCQQTHQSSMPAHDATPPVDNRILSHELHLGGISHTAFHKAEKNMYSKFLHVRYLCCRYLQNHGKK